jgi:hypothetical protein
MIPPATAPAAGFPSTWSTFSLTHSTRPRRTHAAVVDGAIHVVEDSLVVAQPWASNAVSETSMTSRVRLMIASSKHSDPDASAVPAEILAHL